MKGEVALERGDAAFGQRLGDENSGANGYSPWLKALKVLFDYDRALSVSNISHGVCYMRHLIFEVPNGGASLVLQHK
jgi:hypothetical protein